MLGLLKKMFGVKPAEVAPAVESAPYKVPEPAAVTPIPLVVETTAAEVTAQNKAVAVAKAKKAPAKKAPAKKAAAPRTPRKPKTS
jgi:N-acetyl-beta-hexosaminidase